MLQQKRKDSASALYMMMWFEELKIRIQTFTPSFK
jgi:hypothetical protein